MQLLESHNIASAKCTSEEGGKAWAEERDRLKQLLDDRRNALISECEKLGVPLNPTMDGFLHG